MNEPTVAEPPPAEPKPLAGPISESLLSSIRVIRPALPAPPAADAPPSGEDPKPEPSSEPIKDPEQKPTEPAAEPKPKPKDDPTAGLSEKASARFKTLEKHKEEAERDRDAARKELETHKTELEALRKQALELESTRAEAQKAIEESKRIREQLRAASIERDPEFQEKYNGQIMARQQQMLDMVVAAGGSREEFVNAINSGDEEALETMREVLPAHKQRAWDARRLEIEQLAFQRQEAVKNSDKTWAQMEEDRKQRAAGEIERVRLENIEAAKAAVDAIRKQVPDLDKAGAAEFDAVESWLQKAVTEAPREFLIQQLAVGQIAQKVVDAQKGEIDRLNGEIESRNKELDELKEKLGEQETFIKNVSSRVPRPSGGGNSSPASDNGSLLSAVRIRLPGQ